MKREREIREVKRKTRKEPMISRVSPLSRDSRSLPALKCRRGWLRHLLLAAIALLTWAPQAGAHQGPPFPIVVDRKIGSYSVSVWGDPDIGTGTFFIILEPIDGSTISDDLKVEVGVQPVSGRLAEAIYPAARESLRGQVQYRAEVEFDAQEFWRVRVLLHGPRGSGEVAAQVEATPPGFGRWDLLLYLFPFVALGLLWLRAVLRRRSLNRTE